MDDTKKIELIKTIISDAWEERHDETGYWAAMIDAIYSIATFEMR